MWLGTRPTFVQSGSLSIQSFGHNKHGPKSEGSCPFLGGTGSLSNTMWPGLRPTSIPSGILIYSAVWPQRAWAENWGTLPPLWEGQLGLHLTQCGHGRGPACQVSSWSIEPFGHITPTLQTRETDRQDRQRSDSIRRTVLQTIAQNTGVMNKTKNKSRKLQVRVHVKLCIILPTCGYNAYKKVRLELSLLAGMGNAL